jgi:phosphate/sulfate permease
MIGLPVSTTQTITMSVIRVGALGRHQENPVRLDFHASWRRSSII